MFSIVRRLSLVSFSLPSPLPIFDQVKFKSGNQLNNDMPLRKLAYNVVQSSAEDPDHPSRELNAHTPTTKGWQAPRFCSYPQYLVLQMNDANCDVSQVGLGCTTILLRGAIEAWRLRCSCPKLQTLNSPRPPPHLLSSKSFPTSQKSQQKSR